MESSASSPWSAFISINLSEAKKFRTRTLGFDCNWGSFTPVADVAGFLALLSELSESFRFRLLCLWNSSLDGGAVIVVLALSSYAVLSLRTAVKSCSTPVYTPYRALYGYFTFSN
jgi:hypothetical protein